MEFNLKSVEVISEEKANDVTLRVIIDYYSFVRVKQICKLLKERIISVTKRINDAEKFYQNGLITKNEVLKLKVLNSDLELKLVEAENNLTLIRSRFNQVLGLSLTNNSVVDEQILHEDFMLSGFDEYKNLALKKRSELKSMKLKIKASEENIKTAESDFYPQVNLFASLNYDNPNQRIMPLKDEFNATWAAGVNFKWSIWNWGETSAKKQIAKEELNQVKLSKETLLEKIELEVYRNYLKVISENKKLKTAKLKLQQTEENYRIVNKKFTEQLVTASDLSEAETDLLDAKIKVVTSEIDKILAVKNLKKSIGEKLY